MYKNTHIKQPSSCKNNHIINIKPLAMVDLNSY